MGRQYVRQSSASASRAFGSPLAAHAAERTRLQRVVAKKLGSAALSMPTSGFTRNECALFFPPLQGKWPSGRRRSRPRKRVSLAHLEFSTQCSVANHGIVPGFVLERSRFYAPQLER